jgi:hypothetical protein
LEGLGCVLLGRFRVELWALAVSLGIERGWRVWGRGTLNRIVGIDVVFWRTTGEPINLDYWL